MKINKKAALTSLCITMLVACNNDDITENKINDKEVIETPVPITINYELASEYFLSNDGVSEISTFDPETKLVFSSNPEINGVEVFNISNIKQPQFLQIINTSPYGGGVNSVAVANGKVAIAIQGNNKQTDKGRVVIFNTNNLNTPIVNTTAGYLPDMVTFTPDGNYALVANEGEPNNLATIDPIGSVGIIEVNTGNYTDLNFSAFNNQETALEAQGFRVTGETRIPSATNPDEDASRSKSKLENDVEPEYITVTNDSKTAYVALQENNGIAVVDITSKTITKILPLGTKDFNNFNFDFSDKDDDQLLRKNWPVKGYYQPDAIEYFEIDGTGYIISANEGDGREYLDDKDSEDEEDDIIHLIDKARVSKITLDPNAFPNAEELQKKENLGRLKIITTSGDTDGDGDYDELFTFGARSFTIWNTDGNIVYDSGDFLTEKTIELGTYPDGRSDAKGTEPEAVTTTKIEDKTLAFVGLERSGNVFVFDISNPSSPIFLQNLENTSPEGLVAVSAADSPNGKDLLIVSNEHPNKAALKIYSLQ